MIRPVVFRPAARRDLEEAAVWYEMQRTGLGLEFRDQIATAIAMAASEPWRFPHVRGEIRCMRLRRFPYSLLFVTEPDRVTILAVFHARRDPHVWKSRS